MMMASVTANAVTTRAPGLVEKRFQACEVGNIA